jgi:hypothetical protein
MAFVVRLRSVLLFAIATWLGTAPAAVAQSYLGMDRNDYPGNTNMQTLRRTFAFTGYWLNNPPGADQNSWKGKRLALQAMGYGFLLLFNGREYKELKALGDAAGVGTRDATAAVQAANAEGFPLNAIIFLDQEQGGRMLPEQRAYIHAWVDGVAKGGYRAGVYCSGIAFRESPKVSVITANDIRENAGKRKIHFFISNDQCPPSPGCTYRTPAPAPNASGLAFAEVWQYAQSPRRPEVTAACRRTYAANGNCYPPGVAPGSGLHIDMDTADSADPSRGGTH